MSSPTTPNNEYAYLPEDILLDMLNDSPKVVDKIKSFLDVNDAQKEQGRSQLESSNLISKLQDGTVTEDLIAVDGANIVEKLTGSDLLMAIAVGVEGISSFPSKEWTQDCKQYYSWQDALPHHPANARLTQGIMFLMELSLLAKTDHTFRIMDGSHLTSIMKLNSLLSAKNEEFADESYVLALNNFLQNNYQKVIPDIPDIIEEGFSDSGIVGLTKYSSSREILDSDLYKLQIPGDDKTFFGLTLEESEYTVPLPVGRGKKEKEHWQNIHIKCNLDLSPSNVLEHQKEQLNKDLDSVLNKFRPGKSEDSESELYFLYFKPFAQSSCYRIEVKKSLALDIPSLELLLRSIKNQIFYPEIQEPYPQYLVDVIAKNVSFGMDALKHAIRANEQLSSHSNFNLMFSYRSN